ncbi:hypothetical protein CEAn_00642 [Coxiella endosymbiont of Amblyomma nuttalli]|nr:hypothetical protein CEAn_00642 [Coxiella endosymbiont of Amblyomma nuttalli]
MFIYFDVEKRFIYINDVQDHEPLKAWRISSWNMYIIYPAVVSEKFFLLARNTTTLFMVTLISVSIKLGSRLSMLILSTK